MKNDLAKLQKSLQVVENNLKKNNLILNYFYDNVCVYYDAQGHPYEFREDPEYTETILPVSEKDKALEICHSEPLPKEQIEELFKETAIYIIANSLAKKGFKHEAVVWALYNPQEVPEGWTIPPKEREEEQEKYIDILKKKLELKKFQQWALKTVGPVFTEITYQNWSGVHGYTDYDFEEMKVSGYQVYCYSSVVFGGNCQCNSHDPGEEFEYPITYEMIGEIKDKILKRKYEETKQKLETI